MTLPLLLVMPSGALHAREGTCKLDHQALETGLFSSIYICAMFLVHVIS
jgi:hypothetical protein